MREKFLEFSKKINNANTQEEFDKIIDEWKIEEKEIDFWIDEIFDSINEININKLPYVLQSLYITNDKIKFLFFCIILENTYDDLPFITGLDKIPIFKEKFKIFAPTLTKVASNSYNRIADCMYLILLNSDPKGTLLKIEEKERIIESLNEKLPQIISYLKENNYKDIDKTVFSALEILLDVSCYINNNDTLNIIKEFKDLDIDEASKIFLIKSFIINNIDVNLRLVEDLIINESSSYKLYEALYGIDNKKAEEIMNLISSNWKNKAN